MDDLKVIDELTSQQDEQLKKLHSIVEDAIKEEELIIDNLQNPPKEYHLDKNFRIV